MVGVARLELAASASRTQRATSCATPRYVETNKMAAHLALPFCALDNIAWATVKSKYLGKIIPKLFWPTIILSNNYRVIPFVE